MEPFLRTKKKKIIYPTEFADIGTKFKMASASYIKDLFIIIVQNFVAVI